MNINLTVRSNRQPGTFNGRARVALPLWVCAAFLLAGGVVGCGSVKEIPPPPPPAAEQTPVPQQTLRPPKKNPPVQLMRLEPAIKRAVTARLNSWQASIETRDLDKHLQHYADRIDAYYLAANVNRDFVRTERGRAFEKFDTFKLQLINVDISLQTSDEVIITFDKTWDFRRAANYSNGLVQQELIMRKIDKQWFIVSEKDLEIYRYQNS